MISNSSFKRGEVYNAGVSGISEAKNDKINVRINAITGVRLFCSSTTVSPVDGALESTAAFAGTACAAAPSTAGTAAATPSPSATGTSGPTFTTSLTSPPG